MKKCDPALLFPQSFHDEDILPRNPLIREGVHDLLDEVHAKTAGRSVFEVSLDDRRSRVCRIEWRSRVLEPDHDLIG